MQESIHRTEVSELVPAEVKSTAYGIFNTTLRVDFISGGSVLGFFADRQVSLVLPLTYAVATQALAILLLLKSTKQTENA